MRVSTKYLAHLRESVGKEDTLDLLLNAKPFMLSKVFRELSDPKEEVFFKGHL